MRHNLHLTIFSPFLHPCRHNPLTISKLDRFIFGYNPPSIDPSSLIPCEHIFVPECMALPSIKPFSRGG